MRKRFEQQQQLDSTPIGEVNLNVRTRHQLVPMLAALQYIFVTPSINESIFKLLEQKVVGDKKETGRIGMSLWEILVLGVIRLNLNYDYDALLDQANNHRLIRGILGVDGKAVFEQGKSYKLQTLKDNVSLLDEETISAISLIVVKAGHQLKKKKRRKKSYP